MAVQIRQEINILDHPLPTIALSNEKVQLDTKQYNGTVTYYFEVVASNSSGTSTVWLRETSGNVDQTSISVTGATYTLYRSAAFTPTSSVLSGLFAVSGTNITIKSARIVVIQNATTLTNTETQIEIGNYNIARITETAAILTNPKYWKYDSTKWDGTKTFYTEAVYDSGDMDTIDVYLYKCTDITAPSWTLDTTIVSAATTLVPTRTRVAFTPVDGSWYTIYSLNGSMDNHDIYRAGIIVDQGYGISGNSASGYQVRGGTSGGLEAFGQSFTTGSSSYSLSKVDFLFVKQGSPTDNLVCEIRSTSITGTVIGTSDNLDSSTITSEAFNTFTFSTPVSLSASTKYYLRVTRSGARDSSNFIAARHSNGSMYSGGGAYTKTTDVWSAESSTDDVCFSVYDPTVIPTKLEPQYLLANTLFAAGTSLQTFLTTWDSTEWDASAGTITYNSQAEAANGSTSDVTIEQADGGGTVTNSTLTNIDNAQISSSALTMPASENLDTKATTNAGDVAAARILVTYVFNASAPVPDNVPFTNPNLKALLQMGVGT